MAALARGLLLVLMGGVAANGLAVAQPPNRIAGINFSVYDIGEPQDQLYPLVPGQSPNLDERRDVIDFPAAEDFGGYTDRFLTEISAHLEIPTAGDWHFRLTSDDGSRLELGGTLLIDHDGRHLASSRSAMRTLSAGAHPLRLRHFDDTGPELLRLEWREPGASTWEVIPAAAFSIEGGITRVTAPGQKLLFRGGGELRPGRGMPLPGVHPGHDLTTIRPPGFEPEVGGLERLPDGSLAVLTFERFRPAGKVIRIEHPDGPPSGLRLSTLAEGLLDPLGLCHFGGDLWVAQRHEVTRLVDDDADHVAEDLRRVGEGWASENFHHYTFGLVAHNGKLHTALSAGVKDSPTLGIAASPSSWLRGAVIRIDPGTGEVQPVCGGLRAPNGLGLGPNGDLFVTDNQGSWLPASKLIHVQTGRFYGHHNDAAGIASPFDDGRPESPPAVWIPHGEVSKSPSEPALLPGGPFAGQMIVGDVAYGGLKRVFLERVGGEWQGALFRFSQGFEAGINRVATAADGTIYVGGIGGPAGWAWQGTSVGLQRLVPNGQPTFEIESVEALADGFRLTFTQPVQWPTSNPLSAFTATQWTYTPTAAYGGVKQSVESLAITTATLDASQRVVRLVIPDLDTPRVVHLVADLTSTSGAPLWSPEAWYTLNRRP